MDLTIEECRELVANPVFWPRVRDVLWDFAPQIHPSWLEGLGMDQADLASPRIKSYILSALGVKPCYNGFPKDDWSRLLLLDGSTLLEIGKWLGVLACADSLRHITDGKTVRELKTALPGAYPGAFAFTAYFRNLPSVEAKGADEVVACGLAMLLSVAEGLPEPLIHRFKLKLPRELVSHLGTDVKLQKQTLAKLLKLKFSEAYTLCCS